MLGLSQIRTFQHMKTHLFEKNFIRIITILVITQLALILVPTNRAISDTQEAALPDDGIVQLENDMDLIELIRTVSDINNETYILDESVKPKEINIITPDGGMKKEDFLQFFNVILNMNGLSVVKSDGINKIISSGKIKEESTPTIIDLKE
jgi:type II secretory pathway component GspD/PulD (secretin)